MRGRIWEIMGDQFFLARQVDASRYLSALGNHHISILSYFQVEEGCGNHSASILDALVLG